MATAQQLIIDELISQINNDPNINTVLFANNPLPGIIRISSLSNASPNVSLMGATSHVTGPGYPTVYPVAGAPPYVDVGVHWTAQPGDSLNILVNARFIGMRVDLAAVVDPGGADYTTGGGGGPGAIAGGTGTATAQDRRLVVMECGIGSESFGSMFALDPSNATGIPIPTFQVGNLLPAAGTQVGESYYSTTRRQAYVWDGVGWRDVTPSPIRAFANDALLQADTAEPIGTYAVANDTGNMYVRAATGWRLIGISDVQTYADVQALTGAAGQEVYCHENDVLFLRVDDGAGNLAWRPISQMVDTEANILASPNVAGLVAVATDTDDRWFNNGTRWIQDPIEHYATEAALLAATPVEGHMAWSEDTGVVFIAVNNNWKRLQGPQVSVGTTVPTTPGVGDAYLPTNGSKSLQLWTGTEWQRAVPVTYPQPIWFGQSDKDASGEVFWVSVNPTVGHSYSAIGQMFAQFDNEGDRFHGSIAVRVGNGPLQTLAKDMVTWWGNNYTNGINMNTLFKAESTDQLRFYLRLDQFNSGVILKWSTFQVFDLGPTP